MMNFFNTVLYAIIFIVFWKTGISKGALVGAGGAAIFWIIVWICMRKEEDDEFYSY